MWLSLNTLMMCVRKGVLIMPKEVLDWREIQLVSRLTRNRKIKGTRAYVQENCDVQKPSDNIIIYGHHMNDGSMFTGLMKYRNKSFWEGHKTITFDTLTDRHQYEVIAVFKTVVYTDSSDSFKYYEFTDAENAAEFDAYVAKCKELSLYDTGVSAEYGDKLISLSTCEYSRNNGRLVVVAKRVD